MEGYVLVHADGGDCHGLALDNLGKCPGCGMTPDSQSTEWWQSPNLHKVNSNNFDKEGFEEWAFLYRFTKSVKIVPNKTWWEVKCPTFEELLKKDDKGKYIDQGVEMMWETWKRSREDLWRKEAKK